MNSSFRNLIVYKKAFSLAMEIFEISKKFPKEEKYSLTNQIRRSSRFVCSSIAEGYRKRLYEAHFISKISDGDMEDSETQVWLDFSLTCKYIDSKVYKDLFKKTEEIGRLLNHMMTYPQKYLINANK
ncbi:MAG: four helix bundle protein [Ignavibacteriaceae bacterium]